jgi:hypothetical protein
MECWINLLNLQVNLLFSRDNYIKCMKYRIDLFMNMNYTRSKLKGKILNGCIELMLILFNKMKGLMLLTILLIILILKDMYLKEN